VARGYNYLGLGTIALLVWPCPPAAIRLWLTERRLLPLVGGTHLHGPRSVDVDLFGSSTLFRSTRRRIVTALEGRASAACSGPRTI
jgi:hypothetical protein